MNIPLTATETAASTRAYSITPEAFLLKFEKNISYSLGGTITVSLSLRVRVSLAVDELTAPSTPVVMFTTTVVFISEVVFPGEYWVSLILSPAARSLPCIARLRYIWVKSRPAIINAANNEYSNTPWPRDFIHILSD